MAPRAPAGLVSAAADAARFVGASPSDVVPVVNATSAINAVLDSLPLRRGDWVLMLNTTYPAVSTAPRAAMWYGAVLYEAAQLPAWCSTVQTMVRCCEAVARQAHRIQARA